MAIRVLVAEEHAHNSSNREWVEDPGLLNWGEVQAWQIAVDQRQPAAPDEELQYHHDEKSQADSSIHSSGVSQPRRGANQPQAPTACAPSFGARFLIVSHAA